MICVKHGLRERDLIPVISKQNQEYFFIDRADELFGSREADWEVYAS